jgi:hypothetical protein
MQWVSDSKTQLVVVGKRSMEQTSGWGQNDSLLDVETRNNGQAHTFKV